MVVSHSVEARASQAGKRWYEIRRTADVYTIYQQGTYSPDDGRWMGSIAQDQEGNMLLGYSVSDAIDVFPGIRYTPHDNTVLKQRQTSDVLHRTKTPRLTGMRIG
jgi:hypothetical protein